MTLDEAIREVIQIGVLFKTAEPPRYEAIKTVLAEMGRNQNFLEEVRETRKKGMYDEDFAAEVYKILRRYE